MNTTIALTGARAMQLRFERLEGTLWAALDAEVRELTGELLEHIIAAEPSRSGRLRSLTRARFYETDTRISGTIRPASRKADAAKAAALEYGAHHSVAVRAYERASGITVEAYQRHANIAATRFLRDPFAEMQPEITTRLDLVAAKVIAEANAE